MRIGLDTNVLVHAHVPAMEHHAAVRDLVFQQLSAQDVRLVLTPLILHELVHVISDPRRFEPPVPVSEAVSVARDYPGRSNVECLPLDEAALLLVLDLLDRHRLGRKRTADALIATVPCAPRRAPVPDLQPRRLRSLRQPSRPRSAGRGARRRGRGR